MMKRYSVLSVRILPWLLLLLSLISFLTTLQTTRSKIGTSFPGYLTFKNGVVGVYYMPHWSGSKERMSYRERLPRGGDRKEQRDIFSKNDYLLIVLLPAASGLLFLLLGAVVFHFLPASGRIPLLLFHFFVGNYFILSPEAHLTYRLYALHLASFTLIAAATIHFALLFPEPVRWMQKNLSFHALPYLMSGLLLIPYLYFFLREPAVWIVLEYVVLFYVIAGYFFWLIRLAFTLRRPHLEFNRIIAHYLFLGQVVAFIGPLTAAVVIFVGGIAVPLNLATPLILFFPLSLFIGVILGRLRQSQMQLVQTEKWVALGGLLSGLAHEINNPMTFIYSNIEPLQESLQYLKGVAPKSNEKTGEVFEDLDKLVENMREGATRAKQIIENFRYFSYPGRRRPEAVDINRVLDQSINLLRPKWKDRITIEPKYAKIPAVFGSAGELGQVFVNILANACQAIEGEGTIEVVTQKVSSGPGGVEIRIRDSGKGIPKGEMGRIFDPFYTTKAQGEGTGLGLAITLQIVKSHKGKIEVGSEVGKGTEFIMTLPASNSGEGET